MHGADRNADDYFCDMLNLTSYQTAIPASQVAPHNKKEDKKEKENKGRKDIGLIRWFCFQVVVVAPHFKETNDSRGPTELFWFAPLVYF